MPGIIGAKWFAAYTTPRHEKRIAEHFAQRQIESFLPLYSTNRRWKDGSKVTLHLPLFPSYIFVHIGCTERVRVLEVPGVLSLVGSRREATALPESVIEVLRRELYLRKPEPHPYLVIGERVRIKTGALEGMEGILVRKKSGFRVVLSLDQIMQSASVEVDAADLEPVRSNVAKRPAHWH